MTSVHGSGPGAGGGLDSIPDLQFPTQPLWASAPALCSPQVPSVRWRRAPRTYRTAGKGVHVVPWVLCLTKCSLLNSHSGPFQLLSQGWMWGHLNSSPGELTMSLGSRESFNFWSFVPFLSKQRGGQYCQHATSALRVSTPGHASFPAYFCNSVTWNSFPCTSCDTPLTSLTPVQLSRSFLPSTQPSPPLLEPTSTPWSTLSPFGLSLWLMHM